MPKYIIGTSKDENIIIRTNNPTSELYTCDAYKKRAKEKAELNEKMKYEFSKQELDL